MLNAMTLGWCLTALSTWETPWSRPQRSWFSSSHHFWTNQVHSRVNHSRVGQQSWTILVAGASGDLAKKKTYPALLELWKAQLLPRETVIWGFARTKKSTEEFRDHLRPYLQSKFPDTDVDSFLELCFYRNGKSYGDVDVIRSILRECSSTNVLVYLAIPPHVFGETTEALREAIRNLRIRGCLRVILEKPFGRDTASCQELLDTLRRQNWSERELYRIDHYLGKEMVRNIVSMRQHNHWLRPLWNRHSVRSVHIIFKENFGTEGRGGYFDPYGIVRDVLQNHLLQVLSLIAMELPDKWTADNIRNAKVEVLKSIPTIAVDDCLLGQYVGYKDDRTIENRDTVTPTYACVRTWVNNETWRGVPFCLEAGKALNERLCEVRLHFHGDDSSQPSALVFRLQPSPSLYIAANLKTPGYSETPVSSHLGVEYRSSESPEAYTRLLLDTLRGHQESFVRDDELVAAWRIFTPVLQETERRKIEPLPYVMGSTGPDNRHEFLHATGVGHAWLPPPSNL